MGAGLNTIVFMTLHNDSILSPTLIKIIGYGEKKHLIFHNPLYWSKPEGCVEGVFGWFRPSQRNGRTGLWVKGCCDSRFYFPVGISIPVRSLLPAFEYLTLPGDFPRFTGSILLPSPSAFFIPVFRLRECRLLAFLVTPPAVGGKEQYCYGWQRE